MQPQPAATPLNGETRTPDYPGESAQPYEIQLLAEEYKNAAVLLRNHGHRRRPLSWAPCRQTAIHAIELYLNALLLSTNHAASGVRGFQHNLAPRVEAAATVGLKLRKRTELHLRGMSSGREYLISRYAPEMISTLSQINRLMATLEEVATKTAKLIAQLPRTNPSLDVSKNNRDLKNLSSLVKKTGAFEIDEKNGPLRIRALPRASRKSSP
jgi:hypothetical protein